MKTKHTQGNWEVDKRASTRIHCNDRTIAETGGYRSSKENTDLENEANAKLIAAAPELLNVCERVLSTLEHSKNNLMVAEIAYMIDILNKSLKSATT
jgi:hypothetical protein